MEKMIVNPAEIKSKEKGRLNALSKYNILDSLPEEEYDEIVRLASYITQTPVSHISFLTEDRNWFKAKVGVDIDGTSRDESFCQYAIPTDELFFEIPNTIKDDRFLENPFVKENPKVRYYAAVLLRSNEGFNIGTLCVLDLKPRILDEKQKEAMLSLGNMVTRLLEARRINAETKFQSDNLKISNEHLDRFASVVSHDLRSPLTTIKLSVSMMQSEKIVQENELLKELTGITIRKCDEQTRMIENVLEFSRNNQVCIDDVKPVKLAEIIDKVVEELPGDKTLQIQIENEDMEIVSDVVSLHRIFLNLFTNSLKHSDRDDVKVKISCEKRQTQYHFSFSDNGPGIDDKIAPKLFDINYIKISGTNRSSDSHGIGLYSVKSIVERLGGNISLQPGKDRGATFVFHIDDLSSLTS